MRLGCRVWCAPRQPATSEMGSTCAVGKTLLADRLASIQASSLVLVPLKQWFLAQKMPFAIKAPNAETQAVMVEADEIASAHSARFND